jgi:ribonuclease HIII
METITLSPLPEEIQAFVQHYQNYRMPSKNPYIAYFFKAPGATISIYTSGKVVLQGSKAEIFAQALGYQQKIQTITNAGQDFPLIGTDEVGNGSYFGGLAVVACLVTPDQHARLRSLGVGDSKTLDDRKIRTLAPILKQEIQHQALLLAPKKYNQVIASGYNAVSVKVALHNQAIFLLLQQGVQAEKIIIDAFTTQKNYERYVQVETNQVTQAVTLEEKAEGKYLAVAVSSIIARDLFLQNLEDLSQELGYSLPSGAGSQSDKVASQLLKAYGIQALNYSAKLHFKNTEKAKKMIER